LSDALFVSVERNYFSEDTDGLSALGDELPLSLPEEDDEAAGFSPPSLSLFDDLAWPEGERWSVA
jgi:hypothetical protein